MTCAHCGIGLVAAREWRDKTPEQRSASGKKQRHGEFCTSCYHRARRNGGDPARKTWKLEWLIEEAEHLLADGTSAEQVASRLGVKHNSLIMAFARGREKGLTTRRLPYPATRRMQ